jgi:hypothetical protein
MFKLAGAMAHLNFARELLATGSSEAAKPQVVTGCRFGAGLKVSGAGMSWARTVHTDCLTMQSRLALAEGNTAVALTAAERALDSARSERNEDPLSDRYRTASAYLLLGDVHQKSGDADSAQTAWATGLGQLPKGVAERPFEMNTHAELLRKVGRASEARPLEARLASIGYRIEG